LFLLLSKSGAFHGFWLPDSESNYLTFYPASYFDGKIDSQLKELTVLFFLFSLVFFLPVSPCGASLQTTYEDGKSSKSSAVISMADTLGLSGLKEQVLLRHFQQQSNSVNSFLS
jgi:hypothetical protein